MQQVILIAGAAGGIGSYLKGQLSRQATVVGLYHTKKSARENDGTYFADVTNESNTSEVIASVLKEHGRIDVLINATGVSRNAFAHKFDPGAWRETVDTNLVGSFHLMRAVLPHMRQNGFGRIVLLSSVVFQRAVMGTSAYSASKAGLVGLARTVALENAAKGVTCNCLALGYFDMGMLYEIPEELREEIRRQIPMERFGKPEEILSTVRFLLETEYVTGQTISINGGLVTP